MNKVFSNGISYSVNEFEIADLFEKMVGKPQFYKYCLGDFNIIKVIKISQLANYLHFLELYFGFCSEYYDENLRNQVDYSFDLKAEKIVEIISRFRTKGKKFFRFRPDLFGLQCKYPRFFIMALDNNKVIVVYHDRLYDVSSLYIFAKKIGNVKISIYYNGGKVDKRFYNQKGIMSLKSIGKYCKNLPIRSYLFTLFDGYVEENLPLENAIYDKVDELMFLAHKEFKYIKKDSFSYNWRATLLAFYIATKFMDILEIRKDKFFPINFLKLLKKETSDITWFLGEGNVYVFNKNDLYFLNKIEKYICWDISCLENFYHGRSLHE